MKWVKINSVLMGDTVMTTFEAEVVVAGKKLKFRKVKVKRVA